MLYVYNNDTLDVAVSFAIEEHLLNKLDHVDETYFMFYSMRPSIIVGKSQNTVEEINTEYVRKNDVNVVRRLSGGGAVYNDEGDLSFSFITKDDGQSFNNYEKFTKPVIRALRKLGVDAELSGRNDIEVDGKKVSGNAQFFTKGKMYNHGTLMFDVNLENVAAALNPNPEKVESKGVKSVRSRVTNIREHLNEDMDIHEFRKTLLRYIFEVERVEDVPEYELTDEDWLAINQILEEHYRSWEWNYGRSPKFNVSRSQRFPAGTIDVRLQVNKGLIANARIYGDFFGIGDIEDVEERLVDTRYETSSLRDALSNIDVGHYFGNISKEDFLRMLY